MNSELISKIIEFKADNPKNIFYKEAGEKIYKISIDYLYSGKRHQGYLIYIEDDTQNQKYISFLNKISDRLQAEVEKKTEHIVKMQDNLVLSMAMMVEGWDNSTGGHIKRTSDVVKILLDEIIKAQEMMLLSFLKGFIKIL